MTAVMATNGPVMRSQLEVMLDSLMKKEDKPRDLPPALPVRPSSRGRLPSAKKSLKPIRFTNGDSISEHPWEEPDPDLEGKNGSLLKPEKEEEEEIDSKSIPQDLPKEETKRVSEEKLELERRAEKAESEAKEMKEEVSTLEKQIHKYKEMCSKYESQIKSLETELSVKEKENAHLQARKSENQTNNTNPSQENQQKHRNASSDAKKPQIGTLMREFETQKKNFDEGVKVLSQSGTTNPLEDLKRLKSQFFAWKKEYRSRLQDTKLALEKVVHKGKKKGSWWSGKQCCMH